jgi:hypothetical protein
MRLAGLRWWYASEFMPPVLFYAGRSLCNEATSISGERTYMASFFILPLEG